MTEAGWTRDKPTDAVVLLQQARDKVADYVDGKDCPTWQAK